MRAMWQQLAKVRGSQRAAAEGRLRAFNQVEGDREEGGNAIGRSERQETQSKPYCR